MGGRATSSGTEPLATTAETVDDAVRRLVVERSHDLVTLCDLLGEERVEGVPACAERIDVAHGGEYRNSGVALTGRQIRDGPCRDRTCDLGIKSPLLYQLS